MRPLSLALFAIVAACRPNPTDAPVPAATPAPAAAPPAPVPADSSLAIQAIVDDPARPQSERDLDAGRKPAELLAFLALASGMKAADIGAGMGYTTFLLARAVGPGGRVFAQNPRFVRERFVSVRLSGGDPAPGSGYMLA